MHRFLSCALLLLATVLGAPSSARAGRHVPTLPLVEEVARGGAVPHRIRETGPETADGRHAVPAVERETTTQERAWIRRLAEAHTRDDLGPFREALEAGSTWVREVALEGIPYGRIALGWSGGLQGPPHVRIQDLERVAAFLPSFGRLAREAAPLNALGGASGIRAHAIQGLRLLAERPRHSTVADRAFNALLDVATSVGGELAFHALTSALRARPDLQPDERARETLRAFVVRELGARRAGWDVGYLVIRLAEPKLVGALHAMARKHRNPTWLEFVAEAHHPKVPEDVLRELESDPVRRRRVLRAAAWMPSESYLPALETELAGVVTAFEGRDVLEALAAIGGEAVGELLAAYVARRMDYRGEVANELLGCAVDAWMKVDPRAAVALGARLASLAPGPRLAVVSALARHDQSGLLPSVKERLNAQGATQESHALALAALGFLLAPAREPGALTAFHTQLRRFHPRKDLAAFSGYVYDKAWPALLQLARTGSVRDEASETLLLDWLRALPPSFTQARGLVADALAEIGGKRSLQALRPLCAFPASPDGDAAQLRLVARQAVGRLEQRLRN